MSHLHYLQRDGVQRDGSPGVPYSKGEDISDGKALLRRSIGDRHQFRLIISADDGALYNDLKPLTRRFMAQIERDLGTALEWVAVDHSDTGYPHSHIILRGRDELAEDLIIAPEYIRRGMRERLTELVTSDLGPPQDFERRRTIREEIVAERFTSIDRALVASIDHDGNVVVCHRDPLRHALCAGRLKKLEALGFAEPLSGGRWRLVPAFEEKLERLGERGDIVRTIDRELVARGLRRAPAEWVVEQQLPAEGITGSIVARGFSDDASDRHYLILDGADGRLHYLEIGDARAIEALADDAIVRVSAIACAGDGARQNVAGMRAPVHVELLSPIPIEQLPTWEGATWLDRQLVGDVTCSLRDSGFGRKVRLALTVRQQWLIEQQLAEENGGQLLVRSDTLEKLRQRGISAAGNFDPASAEVEFTGKSHAFALVPWQPEREKRLGEVLEKALGIERAAWTLDREAPGLEIG
jgi:type IV secretory pathway VirD2 relaxase